MATLTKGITFGASETITNTKLHNLVDLGAVSNIVNADIDAAAAIVDTKLAQITTTNKVSGTAIGNLASIPSGAGLLPFANIPVISSTYVSMVSIPNASLLPLTLASWVDGSAMRNIGSMPTMAGQIGSWSLVSSLASGSIPVASGTGNFVGGLNSNIRLISTTTFTTASTSGNISITNTKRYFVRVVITTTSGTPTVNIRFNADATANKYAYVYRGFDVAATGVNGNSNLTATEIVTGGNLPASSSQYTYLDFYIGIQASTAIIPVNGIAHGALGGANGGYSDFYGYWSNAAAATSFVILASTGTFSGTVHLYEVVI